MENEKHDAAWTANHVKSLAPDAASIPAAQKVLRKGGFGTVEPTADNRGWWVVCQGLTDTYQVSVRRNGDAFDCECTCPSYKNPCKHALALLIYLVDHPELRSEAETPKTAASDFDALLRAVFAHPDEDTPRFVFADFLEENDQPDRAALIRYQCEQYRLKPSEKRHKELTKLLKPLTAKFRKQIEPLPERAEYELRRGFLRLNSDPSSFRDFGSLPARLAGLFRDGWVEHVKLDYYYAAFDADLAPLLMTVGELDVSRFRLPEEMLFRLVADTAEARETGRLARVKVHTRVRKVFDDLVQAQRGETVPPAGELEERSYVNLTPRVFELLSRAGRLSRAPRLTLSSGGMLGDTDVPTLLAADLSDLRVLRLDVWSLSRGGVQTLVNSPALSQLKTLEIEATDIGGGGVAALARATGLRSLESLRLMDCGLTDADAEALAKSKSLPNLVHLDLTMNSITPRGAAALFAAKHFLKLSALSLHDTAIEGAEGLPLVLDAPDRKQLMGAFAQGNVSRAVGGEVIVGVTGRENDTGALFDGLEACPGAKRVTQFAATRAGIGAAELPDLASGFDSAKLWSLDLRDNPLRNDGAAALATAFARFKLRELKLSACRVQSAGVASLLGAAFMNTLRVFDLSGNTIGMAGVSALLKAEVPPELRELVLTGCRIIDADKNRLKAKYGAKLKV